MFAALSLGGVRTLLVFPGATDTAAFQTNVAQVLVPSLHEGDMVVPDNIQPHLASGVPRAIEQAGTRVLPLSPCNPDDTPVAEMYSKVKEFLRRVATRAMTGLFDIISEGWKQVTPEENIGGFKCTGQCATRG